MPVKRRNAKRRVSTEREYFIWSGLFLGGIDFFGEAHELGLEMSPNGAVPHDAAREAWRIHGTRYLAEHPGDAPWALREFGEPA